MAAKKPEILDTWTSLNDFVVSASEAECLRLLEKEKAGKSRGQFLKRIQSRINRLRSARELAEVVKHIKK